MSSLILSQASYAAYDAGTYDIKLLGFYDGEHTRDDGQQLSFARVLNHAGQVTGTSYRFNQTNTDLGLTSWLYNGNTSVKMGFTDIAYTRDDGYKKSLISKLSQSGKVIGYSDRFNGSQSLGSTAWIYDGENTVNIGYTGANFTRSDGYKYSQVHSLNEAGFVAGSSKRYAGNTELGNVAWLYNGNLKTQIGLYGAEYTRDDGYQSSAGSRLTESGYVLGASSRYNGTSDYKGFNSWIYDGVTTTQIGLFDAAHTRSDGHQQVGGSSVNEAGQVAGSSFLYNGASTGKGQSAWFYNGSNTVNIGFTDALHTRSDGYRHSLVQVHNQTRKHLNNAGQVIGYSHQFTGGAYDGASAWIYDGSNTISIGFNDTEHTTSNNRQSSNVYQLNESGKVTGYSSRYNGGSRFDPSLGESTWIYDGNTTIKTGLTGVEHTRDDGYKFSSNASYYGARKTLNESGQAIGKSYRYNGGSVSSGVSTWFYNGIDTVNTGLTGVMHTRDDGYQNSVNTGFNDMGQVMGESVRFDGTAGSLGQTAWFYDGATDTKYFNDLSIRNSDGYAFSEAAFLGEDGLMLGIYELFDENDGTLLGDQAFGFTVEKGFFDIKLLIESSIADEGWSYLADAIRGNDNGQILGSGLLSGMTPYSITSSDQPPPLHLPTHHGDHAVYLASPVPVPASVWFFATAMLGLIGAGRRKI